MEPHVQDIAVYVLARTDLPSLNSGKLAAQIHHAGTQMLSKHNLHTLVQSYITQGITQGADHFNTTIVLGASVDQITHVMAQAAAYPSQEVVYDVIVDPSYPFFVENMEVAGLIPTNVATQVKVMPDGRVLLVRREVTCAWFVGDRNNERFRALFNGLELHA